MRISRTVGCHGRRLCALAAICLSAAALLAIGISCAKPKPTEPRVPREVEVPAYLKDTVGELTRFSGRDVTAVQGIGFVTGLDGTGTKVMPPGIRQQVLEMMRRHKVESPQDILASADNAVVLVTGLITPGLAKGEVFDLDVRALPTTETTSLEGGFLLECDLSRVLSARGVEAKSEILALGRGSIFVSPFASDEKSKTAADPRVGRVLAGGKSLRTRHFRLALLTPSMRTADQIVRLINARFPNAAKGTEDPGRIDLGVPKEFQDNKDHFLDLIGATYLRETPQARDERLNLLIEALQGGKDLDRVSLCIEAFGPSVVPRLRQLAGSPSASVRFYVGRTLASLQDATAVSILEPTVLDDKSEFQESAVEALGGIRSGVGLGVLDRALGAKSARVRVAAWQAMASLSPRTFVARNFRDKFVLSVVASKADPFVYVSRTLKPQLAVFGDVAIRPPVLAETRRVTATASEGAKQVTVISRWHGKDYRVDAPLDVRGLLEKLASPMWPKAGPDDVTVPAGTPPEGLDLGYSDVVGVLYEMSRRGALSGAIVLQPLKYRITGDRPVTRAIGESEDDFAPPSPGAK